MEKTKMGYCFILFGLFFWLLPSTGEAQISVDCSRLPVPDSLQAAINNNPAGTTFNVTGTCNENITISEMGEGVTLNGVAGTGPTINGTDTANPTVTVRGQGVTIKGFTITGGLDGIDVLWGAAKIDNNTIQNSGRYGVVLAMNSFAIIINNTVTNNPQMGIVITDNSSARIGFSNFADTVASPNTIEANGVPLPPSGIFAYGNGISVGRSSSARIIGNTISNNANNGIVVARNSQADIASNTIDNNGQNGIVVRENSHVNLGNTTGTTMYDLPNSTTVNNANLGLYAALGASGTGRYGTLNGVNGPSDTGEIGFSAGWFADPNASGVDIRTASDGIIQLGNSSANNTTKAARMVVRHYDNNAIPVYLFGAASTATDNFVAFGGGNPAGNAATQLDLFTAPNTTTPVGTPRLTIIGNGNVGIGTQTPSNPLQMASGALVTAGGVWTDASSRDYKDKIEALATEEALGTLKELNPVKFAYRNDMNEKHVGFIAEEVPDLIATKDRKGLSPMDIVAVLTKVVQEQQKTMHEQQKMISTLKEELNELKGKVR